MEAENALTLESNRHVGKILLKVRSAHPSATPNARCGYYSNTPTGPAYAERAVFCWFRDSARVNRGLRAHQAAPDRKRKGLRIEAPRRVGQ